MTSLAPPASLRPQVQPHPLRSEAAAALKSRALLLGQEAGGTSLQPTSPPSPSQLSEDTGGSFRCGGNGGSSCDNSVFGGSFRLPSPGSSALNFDGNRHSSSTRLLRVVEHVMVTDDELYRCGHSVLRQSIEGKGEGYRYQLAEYSWVL